MFSLRINYRAPSTETIFLKNGFGGVRDVRGPYITETEAELEFPNEVFSQYNPSLLSISFELSNRAPLDAIILSFHGDLPRQDNLIVRRNSECTVHFPNIMKPPDGCTTLFIVPPNSNRRESSELLDILSINEISIER